MEQDESVMEECGADGAKSLVLYIKCFDYILRRNKIKVSALLIERPCW